MCLYMEGKPTQVAPKTIGNIQKILHDYIETASTITVIGVAPNADDTHIWNPIASSKALLGYVGPASEPFYIWAQKYRKDRDCSVLADRFENATDEVINFIERGEHAAQ